MKQNFTVHLKHNDETREHNVTIVYSNVNTSAKYLNLTSTDKGIATMENLFQDFLTKTYNSSGIYPECCTLMVYLANNVKDFKSCGVQEMRFLRVYRSDFIYGFGISEHSNKNVTLCVFAL